MFKKIQTKLCHDSATTVVPSSKQGRIPSLVYITDAFSLTL